MCLDIVNDTMEFIERFRRLTIQVDITREIQFRHLIEILNDDSRRLCLTNQSQHLGMTLLAKDNDLRLEVCIILFLDALLQFQYHRTRRINNLDIVPARQFVGLRWFTMSTQQHLHIMQFTHLLMINGDESHLSQALTLHAVMHNIAQTIEFLALSQFLLCFLNGRGHAKTETTAVIYLYLNHYYSLSRCLVITLSR